MNTATVCGVGDIILDAPNPNRFFDEAADILRKADIAIGNMEDPHTDRPAWSNWEPHSAPCSALPNLHAFAYAGFDVATIGGNHCFDQGKYGILDAMDLLHADGVATCGAGENIDVARTPAILERNGIRFAFLHYNLTGPRESYAAPLKTGCAYVRIATAYCNDRSEPGGSPTSIYTVADPRNRQDMVNDILAAEEQADNVIVYFHSGRPGDPALLQYEVELTHHCIDVGAQMVLCAHTHALSSVEVYRGKPIFYGLGNFVTVTGAMDKDSANFRQRHTDPYEWPGIQPYWPYDVFKEIAPAGIEYYPFAEYSRNTGIARATFSAQGIISAGFIPCWINDAAQPEPASRDGKGADVMDYLTDWIRRAGLDTAFTWNEDGNEALLEGVY